MDHSAKLLNQLKAEPDIQAHEPKLLDVIPQEAGPRLTTFRGGAVHSIRPPGQQTFFTQEHYASVMLAPLPGTESAFASDRMHKFDAAAGMLVISPARVESRSIWTARRENVTIGFSHSALPDLAEQEFDQGSIDLHPIPFGTVDQKALYLAQMLKAELSEREAANELYVDSLITLFGIHLLRTYTGSGRASERSPGGLPAHKARRVREYLRENRSRKVSVADLAALCELSPGHFIRAFHITFGQSPHQYLLHLRLSEAERLLVGSNLRIPEIAYLSGFSSQSHLTTAMKRHKNITPAMVRSSR
jgi:AraC family transcriptional regulator